MTTGPGRRPGRSLRIVVVLALGLLAACASRPRSYVVLMPDPDGSVGKVKLEGEGQTRELGTANQLAGFDAEKDTQEFSNTEIRETFGDAIAAAPAEPDRFSVFFRSERSQLDAKGKGTVGDVLGAVKRRTVPEVSVIGRADRAGEEKYNRDLALSRARSVSRELVRRGLDEKSIEVFALGEDRPVVQTQDGVHEPKNRRVDVIVR